MAAERGFYKEQKVDVEMARLIGGPPNVSALITNQIDASAVLVTIEGMNANVKKPGVAMYISVNAQNETYQMEQFVVRKGYNAKSLKELKGARICRRRGRRTSPWRERCSRRRASRKATIASTSSTWAST